jgi:uncharacterized RDD family membrane protein YckC
MLGAEIVPYSLPLLAALLLSVLMGLWRTNARSDRAELASLARRAIAKGIDIAISTAPLGAWAWIERDSLEVMDGLTMSVIALGTSIAWMVVFAIMEGLTGATPGKWITGIRVVDAIDLRRCGIGRAVVRGLGFMIDGLFDGFVGLMMIALSRDQQRMGDKWAGTIVVRARSLATARAAPSDD